MEDSTLDFKLPPGEATLRCQCGFESEAFCFVEHLYRCSQCKSIDHPAKIPFLYQPPKCSNCSRQFEHGDRIHASWMRPAFLFAERNANASPDFIICPKCGDKTLGINSLGVHYQVVETDHIAPSIGDILHARTMKSDDPRVSMFLWSPRLASEFSLSLNVINRESGKIEDGHHEFRVMDAANTDPRLTLEYVRRLPPDEWRWYTGTHGIATEQRDEREPE